MVMKILLTSNSCWNIYNFRKNFIVKLIKQGLEVVIVAQKDIYANKLQDLGCSFYNLKIKSNKISIIYDLLLIYQYFKILKYENPNYIFSFTTKPNLYCSLVARILKFKIVNNITGLGTIFIKFFFLKYFLVILYKFCLKKSYKVFFHNYDDLTYFQRLKIIDHQNYSVIPGSGVDFSRFKFKKIKKKHDNNFVFLYFGRILVEKGINELLSAAKIITKKNKNIKFKILGNVDIDNKSSISKTYLEKLNKEKIIKYIELKDNVEKYIEDCDCVILPSYREGLPKSLLEASAMGRPMLASNVTGCNSVGSARNQWLFI